MINLRCLTLAICAVLVVVCFGLKAQSPAPIGSAADALIGIWSYEEGYVPGLHGELIVSRAGSNWRASLAGAESGFHLTGHEVRFSFAGNRGEYRGTLIKNGRTISGFWLQPSGSTQDNNDPGGSGQPFASPLVLKRAGRNLWRGTVRPLENHFTLYLKIFRNSKGTLVGTFRNPEMNSTGGSSQLRVNRDGSSVQFAVQPDPAKPEIRLNATLTTPDQLQMLWPDLGHTITLTRRKSAQASNFFPRPPGEAKYVYRQPPLTGDGWATARARDVGMDEAALARLVQRLVDADPAASRPGLIHSMLVAYRGKLVLEEYFFGFDRDQPHDTRSAAKTFAS
ncbi:MAG: hypothetical protein ABJB61_09640, partial [bacterium]